MKTSAQESAGAPASSSETIEVLIGVRFNAMMVPTALDDVLIDPTAHRVYFHLYRRAGKKERAWPKIDTIAEWLQLNRKTVEEAIRRLRAWGMLKVVRRFANSNIYILTDPSEWAGDILRPLPQKTEESPLPTKTGELVPRKTGECLPQKTGEEKDTKERGKSKESKQGATAPALPFASEAFKAAWEGFLDMRKLKRAPITPRAMELTFAKLKQLAGPNEATAIAILDQSVEFTWTGIFPLKAEQRKPGPPPTKITTLPKGHSDEDYFRTLDDPRN